VIELKLQAFADQLCKFDGVIALELLHKSGSPRKFGALTKLSPGMIAIISHQPTSKHHANFLIDVKTKSGSFSHRDH